MVNSDSSLERKFGLIGQHLTHSFSQRFFTDKFLREHINASYRLFEIENALGVADFLLSHTYLSGLNVTIPYKERVIPLLDDISPEARKIGAVNVIKFDSGKLIGYNTDAPAFLRSLLNSLQKADITPRGAIILGTGGAAKAVKYALNVLDIPTLSVSRSPKSADCITYKDLNADLFLTHNVIINATPLGMYPDIESYPDIPYRLLSPNHLCFDLVYNPEVTMFMKKAEEQGAFAVNGLEMLHLQALEAWKLWNQ